MQLDGDLVISCDCGKEEDKQQQDEYAHCLVMQSAAVQKACVLTVAFGKKGICATELNAVPVSVLFPFYFQVFWMSSTACPPVTLRNKDNVRV